MIICQDKTKKSERKQRLPIKSYKGKEEYEPFAKAIQGESYRHKGRKTEFGTVGQLASQVRKMRKENSSHSRQSSHHKSMIPQKLQKQRVSFLSP